MDNILARLQAFYKAETIDDPMAIATYVTRRYGTMSPFAMARGIVGKKRAKQWNPVTGKSPAKGFRHGGRKSAKAIVRTKKPKGRQARMKLSLEKAQTIRDTRGLAGHLTGEDIKHPEGGKRTLWHGTKAGQGKRGSGDRPWKDYEGGIRSKANAKEWNPIANRDAYDDTGMKLPKGEKRKTKEEKEREKRGKLSVAGKKGAAERTRKRKAGVGGRQARMKLSLEKSFDVLLKAHKFGGKPLKWEDLPRDPISFATNIMNHKGYWYTNLAADSKGANMRNKLSQGIRQLVNKIPDASAKEKKQGKIEDKKDRKEAQKISEQMEDSWKKGERPDTKVEKQTMTPALASLLGLGAGWALSDTFVEAPRGQMTPSQQRDWERLVRSAMRRKKDLRKDGIDALQSYYNDSSDTYVKRTPLEHALVISKDHAPIPPRQGLMFDPIKHRWTSQEKVGRTVSEVQGKKRIRATGTGGHEHSRTAGGIGGKGTGMSAEAGRRFRSPADAGVIKPHEGKHPATAHQKITKKKLLQHLRGRVGRRTVH